MCIDIVTLPNVSRYDDNKLYQYIVASLTCMYVHSAIYYYSILYAYTETQN